MSEDAPPCDGPTIVVTTDDGTLFSCVPFEIGGLSMFRQREGIRVHAVQRLGTPGRING
jgi:hypothetical protein